MAFIVRVGKLMVKLGTVIGIGAAGTTCDEGTWDFSESCQSAHIITGL